MGLLAGKAGHSLITFGVFRYILGHKALDPVAGIRAAVEKWRHRSTAVSFWLGLGYAGAMNQRRPETYG
jgi:hypothetical protein